MAKRTSYQQIIKSSSVMGFAAVIAMLFGMVRVKFAAIFIGAIGVGLNTSFSAMQGLISTVTGLGISSSAVRAIVSALESGNREAYGRIALSLQRFCFLTGVFGMIIMVVLGSLLSKLTFGHTDYFVEIAELGLSVLFFNLASAQMALLQGSRLINHLALVNIISAVVSCIGSLGFYIFLGVKGVAPSIILVSASQLVISWFYVYKINIPKVKLTWVDSFTEIKGVANLGFVMMLNSLIGSAVGFLIIVVITQQEGVGAVGIYSAASALSGVFVGFVLNSMSSDYYPRLISFQSKRVQFNKVVNEQLEIGLLLALPGLLGTILFAPFLISLFYTEEFKSAVDLIYWFTLGSLGRVLTWPLGYISLAQNKSKYYLQAEIFAQLTQVVLTMFFIYFLGLKGVAIAFATLFVFTSLMYLHMAKKMTKFRLTRENKILIGFGIAMIFIAINISNQNRTVENFILNFFFLGVSSIYSFLLIRRKFLA